MSDRLSELARVLVLASVAFASSVAVAWTATTVLPELETPDQLFIDFRRSVWEAGRAVLDGQSPIREYTDDGAHGSPYPPAFVLTTLPFAVPPYWLALGIWVAALIGSVAAALILCGVRDWRCIALAMCSPPVIAGIAYGNVSPLLVLALAGIWIWRDRSARIGIVLGLVIAGKLLLWPLLVWLLLTRRIRAAAASIAAAALASVIGWTAIAFDRIEDYPDVLRRNASEYVEGGTSVASLVLNLGGSPGLIAAVPVAAGVLAVVVAWRRREDDLVCFTWTVAAALLLSPIVWVHYYALMLVPLALATPRLSRAWLLPFLTTPQLTTSFSMGERAFDAATGVLFTILTARHSSRRDPARRSVGSERRVALEPRS